MTPAERAAMRLRDMVTDNPRFLHSIITDDVRALLAERDRYEKALRRIGEMDETTLINDDDAGESCVVCRFCGEPSGHNEDCLVWIAQEALKQ